MMTDPIADMLTRIRNAGTARQNTTGCPSSKQKLAIANVLKAAGFLDNVKVEARDGHAWLVLGVRFDEGGRPLIYTQPSTRAPLAPVTLFSSSFSRRTVLRASQANAVASTCCGGSPASALEDTCTWGNKAPSRRMRWPLRTPPPHTTRRRSPGSCRATSVLHARAVSSARVA
jgi:small subunit ribosomal protein S8